MCTSKQWSPELDPIKLQLLQATAQEKIDARDAEALQLKYSCYPSTRPLGWVPTTQPMIETDEDNDFDNDNNDEDLDYYNAADGQQNHPKTQLSQHFEQHLLQTEAGPNPMLNVMFGNTTTEQLQSRSGLLQQKKRRGRPRKSEKSSSGGRLPNGNMHQQLNGTTLDRQAHGPTLKALKDVTLRTAGIVTAAGLISNNMMPGRIQVKNLTLLQLP